MNLEDDILIERFLKNELSEEERAFFIKRMQEDAAFKEHFILEQQLSETLDEKSWSYANNKEHNEVKAYEEIIRSDGAKRIKETISEVQETYKNSQLPNKHFRLKLISGIAASILVIFSIVKYTIDVEKIDYHRMADRAWDKNFGLDFALRSSPTDSSMIILNKAHEIFENKQYNEVLSLLKKYDSSFVNYKYVVLFRALSAYKLGEKETSMRLLDTLNGYEPDVAKWYKGLIYLKANNLEKARKYLILPDKPGQEIKFRK